MTRSATGQKVQGDNMAAWLDGARRLSEEGRLAWLLGQGLTQALGAVDGQEGSKVDPAAVVAQLRSWVQKTPENTTALAPSAGPRGHHVHGKTKQSKRKAAASTFSWQYAATRRLEDRAYPIVFVGARQVRGSWCSLALGVDLQGNKHVLGGRDDAQSAALLGELAARGLGADDGLLVITDGNRRLDEAVESHWRGQARVQHCLYRLRHDLQAHAPAAEHPFIEQALHSASLQNPEEARSALEALHQRLDSNYPGAAKRLSRSLDAALTAANLGTGPLLRKYLQIQGMLRSAFERSVQWGGVSGNGLAAVTAGLGVWLQRTRRFQAQSELPQLAKRLRRTGKGTSR